MSNRRLWIFATGLLAGCVALGVAGADAGSRAPVHADFNCDSQVDAGDALGLLLEVSDAGVGDGSSGCVSAQGFAAPDGDVNCDGFTDVGDVIAITRDLGGLEMLAEGCAQPGDDVGAPLVSLRCEHIAEPSAVQCHYDIWQSEHEITHEFDGGDGDVQVVYDALSPRLATRMEAAGTGGQARGSCGSAGVASMKSRSPGAMTDCVQLAR